MKEYLKVGAVVLVGVLIAVFVAIKLAATTQLGGDFPGGVAPSQLLTGNVAGGYVSPVGSFGLQTSNGLWLGGTSQYNEQTEYVTASGTPSAVVTLGPFGVTTSSATTSITLANTAGLSIGAICSGGAATTTVFVSGCQLSTTDGATGTATVAYSNLTGANLAVPTSTVLRLTFDQLPY